MDKRVARNWVFCQHGGSSPPGSNNPMPEDLITTAMLSPEGCLSLLHAMRAPIERTVESGKAGVLGDTPPGVNEDIEKWIIPALNRIAEDDFRDQQLHGFLLCLMGGICTNLEMGMFAMALADLDSAIDLLDGYGNDDVDMEPLGGEVMRKERMAAIAMTLKPANADT